MINVIYTEFVVNFFIIFALIINILLVIACVFKTKDYSLEVLLLGLISFCVLLAIHEFLQLTVTSYKLASQEAPFGESIITEMFSLMASMLVFSVGVTKNRLEKFGLGMKK